MDKLKHNVEGSNVIKAEEIYSTCYGLSSKILRLPQASATVLFKRPESSTDASFGVLYQRLGRDDTLSVPQLSTWAQINDMGYESTQMSKVLQHELHYFPELLERCHKLLTEEVELNISILGYHAVEVIWHEIKNCPLDIPVQQVVLFSFATSDDVLYFAVLQTGALLPVFLNSIKLLIQTSYAFNNVRSKRIGVFNKALELDKDKSQVSMDGLQRYLQPIVGECFSPAAVVCQANKIRYVNNAFYRLLQCNDATKIIGVDLSRYVFGHAKLQLNISPQTVNGCTALGQALILKLSIQPFLYEGEQLYILFLEDKTQSVWSSDQKSFINISYLQFLT